MPQSNSPLNGREADRREFFKKTLLFSGAALTSALSITMPQVAQAKELADRTAPQAFIPGNAVPFYRMYSPGGTDHFYTVNVAETNSAVKDGYTFEGIACYVFPPTTSHPGGTVPFYRLFNPTIVDHFYTTNLAERNNAIQNLGYKDEGIACYVYATRIFGTRPLYRLYSPNATDHFYTTSVIERNNAIKIGYNSEGIACFVF